MGSLCLVDLLLTLVPSIVGFFAALLFVPETKALSLEELDQGTYYPVRVFLRLSIAEPFSVDEQYSASRHVPMPLTRSGHSAIT